MTPDEKLAQALKLLAIQQFHLAEKKADYELARGELFEILDPNPELDPSDSIQTRIGGYVEELEAHVGKLEEIIELLRGKND